MHRRHEPRGLLLGLIVAAGAVLLPGGPAAAHVVPPVPQAAKAAAPGERYTGYTEPEAAGSPLCGEDVCVHWVAEGADAPPPRDADADGVPDYVRRVAEASESSLAVQTAPLPLGLGWPDPVGDGELGGGVDQTDVYVTGLDSVAAGVYIDPGQSGPHRSGYFWVDNELSDPHITVVTTHELNHLLQFAADAHQQLWMMEASASWAEDQLHPEYDSGRHLIADWATRTEEPLTGVSPKQYGSQVWNRWLSAHYGREVIRDAWVGSPLADPDHLSAPAYAAALGGAGSFAPEFVRFSIATAEWRLESGVLASRGQLPDVERVGRLAAGGEPETRTLDHTSFALLDVALPADDRPLVLEVDVPEGLAGGIALVGREGDERTGSQTVSAVDAPAGGRAAVRLDGPRRFSRITAVVVHADATAESGQGSRADFRDAQPFRVGLTAQDSRPPAGGTVTAPAPVTTPPPGPGPGSGPVAPPDPPAACERRPRDTLRSTRRTWIARSPAGALVGCRFGRRPVALGPGRAPFRLAGPFAAFRVRTRVVVVDLRDGARRAVRLTRRGRAAKRVRLRLSARGHAVVRWRAGGRRYSARL